MSCHLLGCQPSANIWNRSSPGLLEVRGLRELPRGQGWACVRCKPFLASLTPFSQAPLSNFPFPLVSLKPHFTSFTSSPSVHPAQGTG